MLKLKGPCNCNSGPGTAYFHKPANSPLLSFPSPGEAAQHQSGYVCVGSFEHLAPRVPMTFTRLWNLYNHSKGQLAPVRLPPPWPPHPSSPGRQGGCLPGPRRWPTELPCDPRGLMPGASVPCRMLPRVGFDSYLVCRPPPPPADGVSP